MPGESNFVQSAPEEKYIILIVINHQNRHVIRANSRALYGLSVRGQGDIILIFKCLVLNFRLAAIAARN